MPRLLSDVRMSTSAQVRRIWSSERGFWDPGAMVLATDEDVLSLEPVHLAF